MSQEDTSTPVDVNHPHIQQHLAAQEGIADGYVKLSTGEIVKVGSHRSGDEDGNG